MFFTLACLLVGASYGGLMLYLEDHLEWYDHCHGWVKIRSFWHYFRE